MGWWKWGGGWVGNDNPSTSIALPRCSSIWGRGGVGCGGIMFKQLHIPYSTAELLPHAPVIRARWHRWPNSVGGSTENHKQTINLGQYRGHCPLFIVVSYQLLNQLALSFKFSLQIIKHCIFN